MSIIYAENRMKFITRITKENISGNGMISSFYQLPILLLDVVSLRRWIRRKERIWSVEVWWKR